MSVPAILLPLFVQVFLTFALLIWMASVRGRALRGGEVRPVDIALRQRAWPERVEQVGNAFANQLECRSCSMSLSPWRCSREKPISSSW